MSAPEQIIAHVLERELKRLTKRRNEARDEVASAVEDYSQLLAVFASDLVKDRYGLGGAYRLPHASHLHQAIGRLNESRHRLDALNELKVELRIEIEERNRNSKP